MQLIDKYMNQHIYYVISFCFWFSLF